MILQKLSDTAHLQADPTGSLVDIPRANRYVRTNRILF